MFPHMFYSFIVILLTFLVSLNDFCHKWTVWVAFFQHNLCWSVINKSEGHCHVCALQTWSLQPFFYHWKQLLLIPTHQREWREHWSAGFQLLAWVSYTMHAHFHVSIEQTDIRAEAGESKTFNSFYCSNCHWIMYSWLQKDKHQAYKQQTCMRKVKFTR